MFDKLKSIFKTEWYLITLMFRTNKKYSILYWLADGIIQTTPLVIVIMWKNILDQLTKVSYNGNGNHILWINLSIYLMLQVIISILVNVKLMVSDSLYIKSMHYLDTQIMEKIATLDLSFFDDPKNSDMQEAAQSSQRYICNNMTWMINTILRIIAFISQLILFLSYNFWFGILFISTFLPGVYISYRNETKVDQWSIDTIPQNREKDYYKNLLTRSFAAKDIRLYNLADCYKKKYSDLWSGIRLERSKLFTKGLRSSFLASLLTYAGLVLIIIMSVLSVMKGNMTIGTLALYIGLSTTTGENFKYILTNLASQIEIIIPRTIRFHDFIQYENMIKSEDSAVITGIPDIEFKNVYFKYPNLDTYVLKDLNFKIESGKKVAIVGVNGAGKTTVVKLLLRFYEIDSGEILINGKNIKEYPLKELYKIFGVCFQDICTYALTLRENIAISNIERNDNTEEILIAAKASGVDKIYVDWPSGIETPLSKLFDDKGIELSRGQWQKVAIARAFFKEANIIILDEPSSALDPEAEDYVFSSFTRLCRDKGGILISHRLSAIMMVDEIILLEEGTVIEHGTHTSLLRKKGKYAEMYRLQAEKYMAGVVNE